MRAKIEEKLKLIYGNLYEDYYLDMMMKVYEKYNYLKNVKIKPLDQSSVYLITYGDSFYEKDKYTLETLNSFCNKYLSDIISDIHILPMFEYTSDDGFSVVDYKKIDTRLGSFDSLNKMSEKYRLMYDFVVNHISKSSDWFRGYLNNEEKYKDFFIEYDSNFDYSNVVRPRTSDLISTYDNGKKVWTTFSEDQVDLNFKSIDILVETTDILLYYIENGATSIRLDAIGFLWKESSTTCIHLKQTHEVIKLWRILIDDLAHGVQIITETNVPHLENISYFGNGYDEASQVYQFALPPLTLHTFISQDSTKISKWASEIELKGNSTFFNFLASHDGIGMRPVEGILDSIQLENIIDKVKENGAKFSYKNNPDGTESIYEINVTYFDAIKENDEFDCQRFIAAHAILLAMPGVPAIYYNSILGSINYYEGVVESGINRRINREKFEIEKISYELENDPRRNKIYTGICELIKLRKKYDAFNPYSQFEIINLDKSLFTIQRFGTTNILVIINISKNSVEISKKGYNLIKDEKFNCIIEPYEIVWLVEE